MRKVLGMLLISAPLWMLNEAKAQVHGYLHTIARVSIPYEGLLNPEGLRPYGELVQTPDGRLYGTASMGGAAGNGTIFYVVDGPNAGSAAKPVLVHAFTGADALGTIPDGLTLGADGLIYGVTRSGGAHGSGTIFSLTSSGTLTTLHAFSERGPDGRNVDGAGPSGKLLQTTDGSFYGVTTFGGAWGSGAVYRLGADGSFSTLYSFAAADDVTLVNSTGANPRVGLTPGPDGNFYGVTEMGGSTAGGVAFRLTTSGEISVLHDFFRDLTYATTDGVRPSAALLLASDGNFYGTTITGGKNGYGVIFRLTPSGTYTILHHFGSILDVPPVADGQSPAAPLIELPDGNLVGTTGVGYGKALGTIFSMSKSGAYRTVFEFMDGQYVGIGPSGGLTRGSNGTLYGLTVGTIAANSHSDWLVIGSAYALQLSSTPTATITVSPASVPLGQNYTVSWNAPEAGSCSLGSDSVQPSGSLSTGSQFAVPGTDVFQLFCNTPYGATTASVVATRLKIAPRITIGLTSSSIIVGGSSELNWQSEFADRCDASGAWSGQINVNGSEIKAPANPGTYNYTISCANDVGTTSVTASLVVAAKPVSPPAGGGSGSGGGGGGGGAFDVLGLMSLLGFLIYRFRRRDCQRAFAS